MFQFYPGIPSQMDVYKRMKQVINSNYMPLLAELDPGLIAAHLKSVLSEGGADHYEVSKYLYFYCY